jgi:hypothetical protein
MKTKHTFAFTFILGLVWTGILFAYSGGPDPGVNGVVAGVTCAQSGCHVGNPVNSGGSVSIGGLPATWTPGSTYDLTVTVTRSVSSRYGFQFSAVNNSTGVQAGSLLPATSNDARVQIISGNVLGNTLQFSQHTSIFFSPGTPFRFRWTAPSSASFGAVRFNVAGNAANGDANSTGDFIYTASSTVSPAAASDSTPPVISAVTSSGITTSTATITWTTDEPSDTEVEFGTSTAYGQSTTLNSTLTASHSASLTGLASNTRYHYRVKSKDALGNTATGADETFITAFGISNLGGVSRTTDGSGDLTIGYGRILATSGTTPSGVAIFGLRQSGILVTEAGVPDQPLITSGRIFAEVGADAIVNTGLAFANPNPTAATITYTIRDTNGNTIRSGSTPIGANSELVGFLNEAPYLSGNGIQGTFSFTSTNPVAAIALRSFLNERAPSEFMLTTLPVVDLAAGANSGTQVIPHFAAGDGWTTQIVLVNPTGTAQTGTIQFLDQGAVTPPTAGAPKVVNIDGASGSSAAYSVAANSSKKFVITGASPGTAVGSVRIAPTAGGPAPTPLVIFTFKPGSFTLAEAGIPVTMGTAFRMFAQLSSSPQILTGVAIANPTAAAGTVTLTLTDLNGVQIAQTNPPLSLPASGQIVAFIDQLIPALAGQTVQGVLQIATNLSSISVAGLRGRYNERADFLITTTPPTLENSTPSITERLFPHLANGGGYTTQFILFSGTAGQTSGGTLNFVKPDGTALDLNIH